VVDQRAKRLGGVAPPPVGGPKGIPHFELHRRPGRLLGGEQGAAAGAPEAREEPADADQVACRLECDRPVAIEPAGIVPLGERDGEGEPLPAPLAREPGPGPLQVDVQESVCGVEVLRSERPDPESRRLERVHPRPSGSPS
jgi:hypothetical protein